MAQDQHNCKECGETFDSYMKLEQHNRMIHSRYTCEHCEETFGSEDDLQEHMRRMHSETQRTPTP